MMRAELLTGLVAALTLLAGRGCAKTVAVAPPGATDAASPPLVAPVTACDEDAGCAVSDRVLSGDDVCCQSCSALTAGTTTWVRQTETTCIAWHRGRDVCLPLNCPVGVRAAACVEERCVIAP